MCLQRWIGVEVQVEQQQRCRGASEQGAEPGRRAPAHGDHQERVGLRLHSGNCTSKRSRQLNCHCGNLSLGPHGLPIAASLPWEALRKAAFSEINLETLITAQRQSEQLVGVEEKIFLTVRPPPTPFSTPFIFPVWFWSYLKIRFSSERSHIKLILLIFSSC